MESAIELVQHGDHIHEVLRLTPVGRALAMPILAAGEADSLVGIHVEIERRARDPQYVKFE